MTDKLSLEVELLVEVVNKHGGQVKPAAREIGIAESTYALKLREAGYERVVHWVKIEREKAS